MVTRTLEELDKLEIQLKNSWRETLDNMQSFFGSELKNFEVKKDIIKLVSEIFENSLTLIEEEKIKATNKTDLKEVLDG